MVQLGEWLFSMAKQSSLYKRDQGPLISSLYKYELSPFCRMKRVLWMDGGDDTTIMCLMSQHSTLKSGEDGTGSVRCSLPRLYSVCSCALTVGLHCAPCCGHDAEWHLLVQWDSLVSWPGCASSVAQCCARCVKLCHCNWKPGSGHLIYLQGLWERLTLRGDVNMRWVCLFQAGREEFQHWGIGQGKGYEVRNNSMCLSNDGRKAWKFMGIKYGRTRSWRGASIQIIQVKKDLDFTSGKRKATERF